MDIVLIGEEYRLSFHYEPDLIDAIKMTIPSYARHYDPETRFWYIHISQTTALERIASQFGGRVPKAHVSATDGVQQKTLRIVYLGKSKLQISTGESIHNGTTGTQHDTGVLIWDVILFEKEVRRWFHATDVMGATTLYGVLGVGQQATFDEIRSAYRRMARQWHPDVCHEENAQEMFLRIGRAYETLNNPNLRVRYDTGLRFESMSKSTVSAIAYIPPLRCGLISGRMQHVNGKYIVEEITDWQDIVENGQVLVTSWRSSGLEQAWVGPNRTAWKKGA